MPRLMLDSMHDLTILDSMHYYTMFDSMRDKAWQYAEHDKATH
jgi:hypothetical protein